jgi:hypothetical protein
MRQIPGGLEAPRARRPAAGSAGPLTLPNRQRGRSHLPVHLRVIPGAAPARRVLAVHVEPAEVEPTTDRVSTDLAMTSLPGGRFR